MDMKKLLQWKYAVPACLAVLLAVAMVSLSGAAGGETGAPTPNPWAAPAPEETLEPTPEPEWAPEPAGSTAEEPRRESLYEAALSIDEDEGAWEVEGRLRLTYVNASEDTLYVLKLRLHGNDVSAGCFRLETVAVNGERAYYELSGENESILTVPLPLEIEPGESAELYLAFNADIPETGGRFGANETGLMLGNFLPIAAVYENGEWRTDPYSAEGDPFYSQTADYRAAVTYPKNCALAATGRPVTEEENYYKRTAYIAAPRVRELALALIPEGMTSAVRSAAGYTVAYGIGDTAGRAAFGAETAAYALDYFSRNIGLYPYENLYVVPFDQPGGMEYPGLVMVDADYFRSESRAMGQLVIAHEVAHQWFYAVVGSDQIRAPWLDESLVEFLAFRCYAEMNGEEAADALWNERFRDYAASPRTAPLDASIYEFAEDGSYFTTVYAHGAALYRALWEELGDAAFFGALRIYFDANSFGSATAEDLFAAFEEAAGRDLSGWFGERMGAGYRFGGGA